ncbi:LysR family transcriptional regulator [Amycolatopsis acidicola]|uniref:LysR family transcriptional regulator n=1 Tax=Amycolatopsis acidicola TaxID=2596893 RepID=A0A5N0V0Y6_9PSEU|nr:LysR family transcriptional regulator [Amycolatopsis acidicola]KAA9157804.1 LysR family transcriptional regulator [Amycolatopsis acidicola]
MNLAEHLPAVKTFLAVARAPSMAEAARALYRSRAAVSRAVGDLETALGTRLFDRHGTGLELTATGRLALARAGRIDAELAQAARICRARTGTLYDGRRLQLVVQLVALRSVSRAAVATGLSQSGASMALSRLESTLGVPLFERAKNGVVPSDAAVHLAVHARRTFAELRHLHSDIASIAGVPSGSVVVGALPLGRTQVLPEALAEALNGRPGLRVTTVESHYDHLVGELHSGDIDIVVGVTREGSDDSGLVREPLFTDRLVVLAGAGHPLAGRRVRAAELAGERWILPREGSPSRRLFVDAFHSAGFPPPRPVVESADLGVVRRLLSSGEVLALASARQYFFELSSGLVTELDVDLPPMTREVALLLRSGAEQSPATSAVIEALRRRSGL